MKRKLATYFPLAVLAVALALMVPAVIYASTDVPMASVLKQGQDVIGDNMQVYLGSASDPGGGASTSATFAIKFSDAYGEQSLGLGLESAHLTEPITVQSSRVNATFDTAIPSMVASNQTNVLRVATQTVTFRFTTDSAAAIPSLLGTYRNQTLNSGAVAVTIDDLASLLGHYDSKLAYSKGNNIKTVHFRHDGVLGGVGAPPQLACNVCKGGVASFTDDSSVRLTRTKEVSPDGLPSGTRSWLR